ncbi:hypothetical protein Bca52824_021947 [Brassica carinata]|uniref:LTI65/LTI78 PGEED repeat domain-containing protein n=1 Tax=Brassica carinata TaxID=52824 RepID=A0A8X8AR22_BRACI|nr:hypothetical protein Bca52824_021947 [Brassica carinata]
MEALTERAGLMKESLQKSQTITDNMVGILGSFDHRLSALETAMRPTQIRTHSIRRAHENIDKALKQAELILDQFDLTDETEQGEDKFVPTRDHLEEKLTSEEEEDKAFSDMVAEKLNLGGEKEEVAVEKIPSDKLPEEVKGGEAVEEEGKEEE